MVGSCDKQMDPFSVGLTVQVMEKMEQGQVKQRRSRPRGQGSLFLIGKEPILPYCTLPVASMWRRQDVC